MPIEAINNPNTPAGQVSMPAELTKNVVDILRQFLISQGHNIVPTDIYYMQVPWVFKCHDAKSKKDATDAEYVHIETGQKVNVRAFGLSWMLHQQGGKNSQRLLVASGGPLVEPVILARARKGAVDYRIWRGADDNPYEQPTIVKRPVTTKNATKNVSNQLIAPVAPVAPPQISYNPFIKPLFYPQTIAGTTLAQAVENVESTAQTVNEVGQVVDENPGLDNIDPQLWSSDSFESILESAAENASPFSQLASPDITFTETPSKKRKRGNHLDLTVCTDSNTASLDNFGRGSNNGEVAVNVNAPKPVARRLFNDSTTIIAPPVSGNSAPDLPTPVSNFTLSPMREDSPPTGTTQNIIFKFIGTRVRERTLSQLTEFKLFLSHTTAAGIITEEDRLQMIKCSIIYPDGQEETYIVVDALDFLEMTGQVLTKPGLWHLPDASCVITVQK
jgi:hypothetical protein